MTFEKLQKKKAHPSPTLPPWVIKIKSDDDLKQQFGVNRQNMLWMNEQ
jgi:hypothetical protein